MNKSSTMYLSNILKGPFLKTTTFIQNSLLFLRTKDLAKRVYCLYRVLEFKEF